MAKKRLLLNQFLELYDSAQFESFVGYISPYQYQQVLDLENYINDHLKHLYIDYGLGDSLIGKRWGGINIIVTLERIELPKSIKGNIPDLYIKRAAELKLNKKVARLQKQGKLK